MKKLRSVYVFAILLILAVCTVTGILFFRPSVRFTENMPVLEKGNVYPAEDLILSSNGTVTPEVKELDTTEVGRHSIRYKVKKGPFEREVLFFYEVIDTTPPIIEIKETTVIKDFKDPYTEEDMLKNVTVNEGRLEFETDYDPKFSGIYTVNITATDDYDNVSTASYEVMVKDSEAPYVFKTGNGARILKGSTFDFSSIVSYGDNADPKPLLEVEGEVNTNKVGHYPLHARLTDYSGNITAWDLTVEVVNSIPEEEPDIEYYPFEQFLADYAGEGRKFGIDISSWQGDIDFKAVKDAGCEFVIIRLGLSYLGELTLDKKFTQNLEGAREAGLPVGIYLFCYDNNEEDLRSSLDSVFARLGDERLELPLVFDWENFGNYHEYEISFQGLNHLYDVFEEEVKEHGYQSMLYGSKFYLQNVWTDTESRPVWLAHYVTQSTYDKPYQIWQVSDSGKLDGIKDRVDLDIIFTQE